MFVKKDDREMRERVRVRVTEVVSSGSDVRVFALGGKPFGNLQISLDEAENSVPFEFPEDEKLKGLSICILGPEDN